MNGSKRVNRKPIAILCAAIATASLCACGESDPPGAAVAEAEAATPPERRVVSADAYVPMLEVPDELPADPGAHMAIIMLESTVVPSANDVNIRPYPGARLMAAMAGMEMSSDSGTVTSWPTLSMLSDDEVADVVAFYAEQLPDWRRDEMFGIHTFWNGDENSNPLDISGQFSLVSLTSVAEDDTIRAMWPEMRTRIDVRYQPAAN